MISKYFEGKMPADSQAGGEWPAKCAAAVAQWNAAMDELDLAAAAHAAMSLLREVDAFIHRTEPFKLAKDPARIDELCSILAQCAETVRIAGVMLEPFLPEKMAELRTALGQAHAHAEPLAKRTTWGQIAAGTPLVKCALFPRVEA
jgi:methionyl-tRNA synthetase